MLALVWMVVGVGFYSFNIGNLSAMISTIDFKAAQLQNKLQMIQEFVRRTQLPTEIEQQIKHYIENNHKVDLEQVEQKKLLAELPQQLRSQVIAHTHGEIVRKIRFFEEKSQDFIWTMLPLFAHMNVYKKDFLYNQGDQSEEVFFIFKGRVKFFYKIPKTHEEVEVGDDSPHNTKALLPEYPEPINLHVEGSYFGDNDVLLNQGRDGRDSTAIAERECHLLVITKQQLIDLLKNFPHYRKEMKKVAERRKNHHLRQIEKLEYERLRAIALGQPVPATKPDPLFENDDLMKREEKKTEGEMIFEQLRHIKN